MQSRSAAGEKLAQNSAQASIASVRWREQTPVTAKEPYELSSDSGGVPSGGQFHRINRVTLNRQRYRAELTLTSVCRIHRDPVEVRATPLDLSAAPPPRE